MAENKAIEKLILVMLRKSQLDWNASESMSEDSFYHKGRIDVLTELLCEVFDYDWCIDVEESKDLL